MLLSFFNKNTFANILAIIVLGSLLWFASFLAPISIDNTAPASCFRSIGAFRANLPKFSVFIAFLFTLGQAFYFNFLVIRYNLFAKNNYMVAFIYMLLMSSSPALLSFNEMSMAGFLVLFQLNLLISSYKKANANNEIFNVGLISCLLMLLYAPLVVLQLFVLICIALVRPISLREYMISFMGFLLPLLVVFTFYYCQESLGYFLISWLNISFLNFEISEYNSYQIAYFSILTFLFLLAFFKILTRGLTVKTMLVRKTFSFMYWLFLFSLLIGLFNNKLDAKNFAVVFIPGTIFLSNLYLNTKSLFWHELIFAFFLIFIILRNWLPL